MNLKWPAVIVLLLFAVTVYGGIAISAKTHDDPSEESEPTTTVVETSTTTEPEPVDEHPLGRDAFVFEDVWEIRTYCHKGDRFYIMNNSLGFEVVPDDPVCAEGPQ